MHTHTRVFNFMYVFFNNMDDDLCYRDTPFFVGGIRAAAASVRRSHVARLPRSPNPYAHLPHHPSIIVFLLTPSPLQNCEIRAIVTRVGRRAGRGPPAVLLVIIIVVVLLFCQRPMTRENREQHNSV